MLYRTPSQGPQLCPSCGSKLVAGDCVECDRPRATARGLKHQAAPARAYGEIAGRLTEPVPDVRRASGEWLNKPTDDAPATRRAHPGQVRTAIAEAELKARQKAENQAARSSVTQSAMAAVRSETADRDKNSDGSARRSTAPRVRALTPIPPAPEIVRAPVITREPTSRPKTVPVYVTSPAEPEVHRRLLWAYAAAAGVAAAALAFLLAR